MTGWELAASCSSSTPICAPPLSDNDRYCKKKQQLFTGDISWHFSNIRLANQSDSIACGFAMLGAWITACAVPRKQFNKLHLQVFHALDCAYKCLSLAAPVPNQNAWINYKWCTLYQILWLFPPFHSQIVVHKAHNGPSPSTLQYNIKACQTHKSWRNLQLCTKTELLFMTMHRKSLDTVRDG